MHSMLIKVTNSVTINNSPVPEVHLTYTLAYPNGKLILGTTDASADKCKWKAEKEFGTVWWTLSNLGYQIVKTQIKRQRS